MKLFCYGTLMRGQRNHARLEGAVFLRKEAISADYQLFDNGSYPALKVVGGGYTILGELYDVPDEMWPMLDSLEGVAGEWYVRELIETKIKDDKAIIYIGKNCFKYGTWEEIPSGDYHDHK